MSIEIARLPVEMWPLVETVVTETFQNAMPSDPKRDTFVAALEDGKLAGFVHIEVVFHFNCVYVTPEHEHNGLAKQMIDKAVSCIPPGFAGIWLADRDAKDDLRLLAQSLGARDVGMFRYYRKDGGS